VRPLPQPSLDLQDSSLARALDELASIGTSSGSDGDSHDQQDDFASAVVSDSDDQFQSNKGGSSDEPENENAGIETHDPPPADVVDLKPLPPPDPIELNPVETKRREPPPPASFDGDSSAERGWKSTRQGDSWKRLLASTKPDDSPDVAPGEAAAAGPVPVAVGHADAKPAGVAASTQPAAFRLAPSTWFAIAGIGALIFAAGFWSGRITTLQSSALNQPPADASDVESSSTDVQTPESATDSVPAIQGRITRRYENGEIRPDVGARIFVLPFEHADSALIPSDSVWIDATNEDREQANKSIRELGGGFEVTGASGEFRVELPNSGKFHVLVLCNSRVRDDADDISDVKDVVGGYFDNPTKLLGHVMLHLDEVQHPGTGTTYWDFQFPRS